MKQYSIHQKFGALACFIVGIAVVWGFVLVGSPTNERARRVDEKRVQHLREIHQEILSITHDGSAWGEKKEELPIPLPETLQEVVEKARFRRLQIVDPVSGAPYTYTVTDTENFTLCATFDTARDQEYDILWNHPAGPHCFNINALDTDLR